MTGIRQDPFAEKNRIQVEVEKSGEERGKYVHPEAYNLNQENGIDFKHNNSTESIEDLQSEGSEW